ncbi:MAG: Na+/H+ antiporter NhaC family protein, partial [Planctomycetota bacterium]
MSLRFVAAWVCLFTVSSVAFAQSDAAPHGVHSFVVERKGDGPIFSGTRATFSIRAVDEGGRTIESFRGPAELEGAFVPNDGPKRESAENKPAPVALRGLRRVATTPEFQAGVVSVEKVLLPDGKLRVRLGRAVGQFEGKVRSGAWTLVPPLVAIFLAILTRQVIVSLFCGIWIGALILFDFSALTALLRTGDRYLVKSLADEGHAFILLFSLTLAGLVGLVTRMGGIRGVVDLVSRRAKTSRSGQVATWFLGLLIFFDDYANCMIIGNTMRPFADKVKISREKLAFLIDATAAPIATIGIISTWTAYQVGLVTDVLGGLPKDSLQGIAPNASGAYALFLQSIPYSFYSLFMIVFVFLSALTLADFGPMLTAE